MPGKHWRALGGSFAAFCCVGIMMANYWLPAQASEEYLYTVRWLANYLLPFLTLGLFLIIVSKPGRWRKYLVAASSFMSGLLLTMLTFWLPESWRFIPSLCWLGAFVCLGSGFFALAARARAALSTLFCALGSLLLAFGAGEGYLLATGQGKQEFWYDNQHSKYVLDGSAKPVFDNVVNGVCGSQTLPRKANIAERLMSKDGALPDEPLFDVKYSFDARGQRILPPASPTPRHELLLFGCSFTFGYGLENEQTWAWQLARDLGADWQLRNYSFNGYGANQMLCLLEQNLVAMPQGQRNFALFLAIQDHLRRNEFFANTPHYVLESDEPAQGGQGKYIWLNKLPDWFKGSRLARQAAQMGTALVLKLSVEQNDKLYLAMLKRAAKILCQKYKTELLILLWPDLEYLRNPLEAAGLTVLSVKNFLKHWDETAGKVYLIAPPYETHPNARAAAELAKGLGFWLNDYSNRSRRCLINGQQKPD